MQNLSKKRRKGFTLTELAIVIAVIAILIAVLVPTFVSIINKANESVDEQAVKNMNTALSIHESTEDFDTVADVVNALAEDSYDLDNYSPLISGMQFYWVKKYNRVVYADSSTYAVSYPEEYTSLEYSAEDGWYSLNGDIELDDSWEVDGSNTVKIKTGEQLASLMESYSTYSSSSTTLTIELQNDVDLMGASYKFGDTASSSSSATNYAVYSNLTITSANSKTYTIYGFRNDANSTYAVDTSGNTRTKGYAYGLFSSIQAGATVTIKNVNFSGMAVKDTTGQDTGTLGLISGYILGTLNMENVKFTDCYVSGGQKVAAICGQLNGNGSVNLKNVTYENTKVVAYYEGAKLIAYMANISTAANNQSFSYDSTCNFDGITVEANKDYLSYDDFKYATGTITTSYTTTSGKSYETLFVVSPSDAYKTVSNKGQDNETVTYDRGTLMTVVTQALYLYEPEKNYEQVDSKSTMIYSVTINYNNEKYYLRSWNTPGDTEITSKSDSVTAAESIISSPSDGTYYIKISNPANQGGNDYYLKITYSSNSWGTASYIDCTTYNNATESETQLSGSGDYSGYTLSYKISS